MSAQHSSESNEHYTPEWIVEKARRLMDGIDLDPASCEAVNRLRVRAKRFFVLEQDALTLPWRARSVFLNPPGGRAPKGLASQSYAACFWAKLVESWLRQDVDQAFFVGFNVELLRTSQVASFPLSSFPLVFPAERVAYDQLVELDTGEHSFRPGRNPPHSSVFAWLPPAALICYRGSALDDVTDLLRGVFNEDQIECSMRFWRALEVRDALTMRSSHG